MKIKIDQEMQKYFNLNIDNYQKVLDTPQASLIDKFKAECAINSFKHAQRFLDNLQYKVSQEVSK